MATDTIPARLREQARNHPEAPAYHVKEGESWPATSYGTYNNEVQAAARALIALGHDKGHSASILGFNRPEWTIFFMASQSCGGVPAGIYTTCSPPEVSYIIGHAESRIVLLENEDQWKKVEEELGNLPKVEHVVLMKGTEIDHDKCMTWEEFLAKGEGIEASAVDERIDALEPGDLATLIYTSGTTGPPKGVMLSHDNLAWTASAIRELLAVEASDCSLSYLPLCHIAEQMFSLHGPITHGMSIYFAESIDKVPDNLKEVQPTVVFAVPRIWEKFHAGVSLKLKGATGLKAKLVTWAMGVGRRNAAVKNSGGAGGGLSYAIANKLIFSKLRPALGLGRARYCVSGAAPIAKEVLEFMAGLDVTIHEVYGQSEDAGPTSFNRPGKTRFGSVGPPVPGVEVKIAEDGEILVKGRNVFLGYYKSEKATNETLIDGWLYSGDLGKFDSDGFLHITGRKKDIIITAGGKNIAPKNIEAALKNTEFISEAVVIGDRRKFLSALVCLDPDTADRWATAAGTANDGLHENAQLRTKIEQDVEEVNKLFARVEHIRKFTILPRPLTIEDGELTPTLKVKRSKVNEKWADAIEAMYADA